MAFLTFSAPSSSVTIRTWSYAGGMDVAGDLIPEGGFDPILSVFNITGGLNASSPLVNTNDNGAFAPGVSVDSVTGLQLDSLLVLTGLVSADTYLVVLTESDNSPLSGVYGGGFSEAGNGNFTEGLFGCSSAFCDLTGTQRDGAWEVDIDGVGSFQTPTPEPASILLIGAGLAAFGLVRKKVRS